jgi:hypothetical protein
MSQTLPDPAAATPAQILAALIAPPPPVPPHTFELALVMGGTVSSGAYTAGAVDFLVEALDCFQAAKTAAGPYHNLVLKVLSGTSGGGVTAAILARALAYKVPPMSHGAAAAAQTQNPLYNIWVKQLDIAPMLDPSDIGTTLNSLLNATLLDTAAKYVETYAGDALPAPRDWVGAPLTVFMTHTNLSGIPFNIDFGGGQYQRFIDHADYVRFAICYPWQPDYTDPKPWEYALNTPKQQDALWPVLGNFALASAAFPVGFPARLLDRPRLHYQYRAISTTSTPSQPSDYWIIQPDWTAMDNTNNSPNIGNFRYSAVDGGVANNEPIGLARTALCGLLGQNPRSTLRANRAVWLIDPFAGEADMGSFNVSSIFQDATSTLNTLLQQTRYGTADLILATDPDIYSRYMLSASNATKTGNNVLATSGLDAFLGFTCEAFRDFDYCLGRKNCQDFLRTVFRQSADNPVFNGWTADQKTAFRDAGGDLPLIPLFGSANDVETLPSWPAGALRTESLRPGLEARYKAILNAALPASFWGKLASAAGGFLTEGDAASHVIGLIDDALTKAKLS